MTSIVLGQGRDGSDTCIDLPELLATRLLVQGNSGSGKSHLLRRLLEQTATLVQQVVIDPEGDFVTLADRYGHLVINVEEQSETSLRAAGERVRVHRASVILNLEHVDAEMQLRACGAFLNGMFEVPRAHWYPVLIIVDEAQLFAPVTGGDTSDEARRLSLGAMTNLMCRGRKRGMAGVIATQRLAKLAKNVAAEASNFLMGRTFLDIDMSRAADLLGMERRSAESFRDLSRGQFMTLGPALSRRPKLVSIGSVETASNSTGPILLPLEPVASEDLRDIILEPVQELSPRPRRENRPPPPDLIAQLDAYGATRENEEKVEENNYKTDLSPIQIWNMVSDVASEDGADYKPIAILYQDFQMRARIKGLPRNFFDLSQFQRFLTNIRAGLNHERLDSEDWQKAESIARKLPEDIQSVFLLLAKSALDQEACPTDERIARAYGTHSLGRARRQLVYLEERETIVIQETPFGRRISIVGLGWQTA